MLSPSEQYFSTQDTFEGGLSSPIGTEHIAPFNPIDATENGFGDMATQSSTAPMRAGNSADNERKIAAIWALIISISIAAAGFFAWLK